MSGTQVDWGVLGRERDSTLCGPEQFFCSVTGLYLPHLDHQVESLPLELRTSSRLGLEYRRVAQFIWESPLASLPYSVVLMPLVEKSVGDHEALWYRRWDRGRSHSQGWQTEKQWKKLLAWTAAGEGNQMMDRLEPVLYFHFLEDKESFEGRGNVENPLPGGGLLMGRSITTAQIEELGPGGAADRTSEWDPGGAVGRPSERDPGVEHDAGRSGEVDPG